MRVAPRNPGYESAPSAARSRNMAAIRRRDTKPELAVRRALHAAGYRFRIDPRDLPGRPDIVLPRFGVAVFVHGCFWHGHTCVDGHIPKTNANYWEPKILRNAARDRRNISRLRRLGWSVVVIRECQVAAGLDRLFRRLAALR